MAARSQALRHLARGLLRAAADLAAVALHDEEQAQRRHRMARARSAPRWSGRGRSATAARSAAGAACGSVASCSAAVSAPLLGADPRRRDDAQPAAGRGPQVGVQRHGPQRHEGVGVGEAGQDLSLRCRLHQVAGEQAAREDPAPQGGEVERRRRAAERQRRGGAGGRDQLGEGVEEQLEGPVRGQGSDGEDHRSGVTGEVLGGVGIGLDADECLVDDPGVDGAHRREAEPPKLFARRGVGADGVGDGATQRAQGAAVAPRGRSVVHQRQAPVHQARDGVEERFTAVDGVDDRRWLGCLLEARHLGQASGAVGCHHPTGVAERRQGAAQAKRRGRDRVTWHRSPDDVEQPRGGVGGHRVASTA